MAQIPELGDPKYFYIECPACKKLFHCSKEFFKTENNKLLLHCPFCHLDFDKNSTDRKWGI